MPRTLHSLHSPEFKEQALLKARGRGARSLASVADDLNMSHGTLKNWLKAAGPAGPTGPQAQATHPVLEGPVASWSSAQRMGALHESYSLSGEALAGSGAVKVVAAKSTMLKRLVFLVDSDPLVFAG